MGGRAKFEAAYIHTILSQGSTRAHLMPGNKNSEQKKNRQLGGLKVTGVFSCCSCVHGSAVRLIVVLNGWSFALSTFGAARQTIQPVLVCREQIFVIGPIIGTARAV